MFAFLKDMDKRKKEKMEMEKQKHEAQLAPELKSFAEWERADEFMKKVRKIENSPGEVMRVQSALAKTPSDVESDHEPPSPKGPAPLYPSPVPPPRVFRFATYGELKERVHAQTLRRRMLHHNEEIRELINWQVCMLHALDEEVVKSQRMHKSMTVEDLIEFNTLLQEICEEVHAKGDAHITELFANKRPREESPDV